VATNSSTAAATCHANPSGIIVASFAFGVLVLVIVSGLYLYFKPSNPPISVLPKKIKEELFQQKQLLQAKYHALESIPVIERNDLSVHLSQILKVFTSSRFDDENAGIATYAQSLKKLIQFFDNPTPPVKERKCFSFDFISTLFKRNPPLSQTNRSRSNYGTMTATPSVAERDVEGGAHSMAMSVLKTDSYQSLPSQH
jgi:hypothetical protein